MPKAKEEIKDSKSCIICERELASENYCTYHEMAYQNVMQAYNEWQKAYGELTFSEYLKKLIENTATGIWAKDVVENLLNKENSKK